MKLEIVDGKLHHCGKMARNVRLEQKNLAFYYGRHIHRELVKNFNSSIICKTAILDGKVVSMGGASSDFISDICHVWFALSDNSNHVRFSVLKELIKNIEKVFLTKNKVVSLTDQSDKIAVRMARFLGFQISHDTSQNYGTCIMMEINKQDFRRQKWG